MDSNDAVSIMLALTENYTMDQIIDLCCLVLVSEPSIATARFFYKFTQGIPGYEEFQPWNDQDKLTLFESLACNLKWNR